MILCTQGTERKPNCICPHVWAFQGAPFLTGRDPHNSVFEPEPAAQLWVDLLGMGTACGSPVGQGESMQLRTQPMQPSPVTKHECGK